MRFIHFADLHIGVESYGRPDPTTGLNTRLLDFLGALDELVDRAIAEDVDLVIFAGDAYKTREPSQTHQREFAKRIRRLVDAGIPLFMLIGNHDLPNAFSRATALAIFDTLGVPGVTVASAPGITRIETKAGPLQVAALPWPNISSILTRDDYKNYTLDQLDREVERRIASVVQGLAAEMDPSLPAVLAAHVAMSESLVKSGSEKWMTVGQFPQVTKSTIGFNTFDYVALGHHHVMQRLEYPVPMYYSGSLQRVDFGEEHDPKGFLLVELDPALRAGQRMAEEPQFCEVKARRFVTVSLRPRDADPIPEVLAAIAKADIKDAIVRVQVQLTATQDALFRDAEVRAALEPAHYLASIQRQVEQEDRRRLGGEVQVEGLTPLDALGLYMDQREAGPEERQRMLALARSLIAMEDMEPDGG